MGRPDQALALFERGRVMGDIGAAPLDLASLLEVMARAWLTVRAN
jgi:hypothetical protein